MTHAAERRNAAPKASPGGKLAQNRLFGTDFVTDEECGQKCFVFYAATGFFLHFRYRRSSSVFFIALGMGDEKSTFPPGEGMAACGGKRCDKLQFTMQTTHPGLQIYIP